MYTIDENTEFLEEKAGGVAHKFYLLSPQDRVELAAALKKQRRDILLANLNDSAITGEQRYAELEAFEERWKGRAAFVALVNSEEGDVLIPARALRKDDPAEADKIVRGLRIPQARMLAFKAGLSGLELLTGEEAPDPNPQAPPATYSTPDLGAPPAESPTGSPA